MGMIGNFGSRIVFETSDRKILTFSGLSQKVSGKYSKHRSVSFKIMLDVNLGIRPQDIIENIEDAIEQGEVEYLVIGGKPIGKNRFYISSVSEAMDVVLSNGGIARATLSITMEEYI